MEITLTRQAGTQILVTCDDRTSHTFDLRTLIPGNNGLSHPLDDPVAYGKAIYQALFPQETAAWKALKADPDRILFVATDDTIDAIPWEYAYGPDDFVVLESPFVRGLPADQRIKSPMLDKGLHIIAVPSNPLSHTLESLNIDGEWIRLKEIIQELAFSISLERTRPPTLERLGLLVANQQQRTVHFMGHGGQDKKAGAILCFEQDNGDLDAVTARDFMRQLRGTVFLVTLNACASATAGETHLSNLALALVRQKSPYALGMRFSIPDGDALAFSRTFYSYLARGSSVEEAVYQVRLALSRNRRRQWMLGVPVLYTCLAAPATGFVSLVGSPEIKEYQPKMEVSALPRAEGTFQGRIDELKLLGALLTADLRPPLITIHGSGGQGKTALAREAVERFAYAWPGEVWATSLENLPSRELFVSELARFLGIDTQKVADREEVERMVLAQLVYRRMLIVLDNAETLVEAVETNNEEAIRLAQFLREQLPRPPVSLLATSRSFLGWAGEIGCELTGLAPRDGVKLFQQHAPQRLGEIDETLARGLSKRVEGHPFSLRLLSSAFNTSAHSFPAFVKEYEAQLLSAENKYVGVDHRHRTLYASIETSVRFLDAELADLFSKLWLFHAPFLPETAVAIFDPEHDDTKDGASPIYERLSTLWRRGLLTLETATLREGTIQFYHVLPTIRPYIEKYLARIEESEQLLTRFVVAYAFQIRSLYEDLDRGGMASFVALQCREDLERAASGMTGVAPSYYLLNWGSILSRVGDTRRGLQLMEQALEVGQGQDRKLEMDALNNIATVYYATGQAQRALELNEQALLLRRETGDLAGEAITLDNLAAAYDAIGQPQRALELLEQAMTLSGTLGDREGEAGILLNMGAVYHEMGQPQRALELYDRALALSREFGNRWKEASTLNNMGEVYRKMGQPQQALELYDRALALRREVKDLAGEADTLNNMAVAYNEIGQTQMALDLHEQVLPLLREVGDRAREANTLNNMAAVYHELEQLQRALELLEQALPLVREVRDRGEEARTLSNMGKVYQEMGQPQRALELYNQALALSREVGNHTREATSLSNLGLVYRKMGQFQRALEVYKQVLPLVRKVGDRAGEANTLTNMALAYNETGQSQRALEVYKQALPLLRKVGNRAGEAASLTSMGIIYRRMGQSKRAMKALDQALPLLREVGNRAGEVTALNNIGKVYYATGQPKQALEVLEQVLLLVREVEDRAGEAATLNNIALIYQEIGQPQRALEVYKQALPLRREVGDRAGEAATLANMAEVLYRDLNRPHEAIPKMEQAIAVLVETGLAQDANGQTRDDMRQYLDAMRQSISVDAANDSPDTIPAALLEEIVDNTIAILTTMQEHHTEWREVMATALQQAKNSNRQQEADFLAAILAVLHGESPTLPGNHPYASALAKIQEGVATGGLKIDDIPEEDDLPFDAELIPRSIEALSGGPQEKMAHIQYLVTIGTQTADEELKAFLQVIQLGLLGSDLSQLGETLSGVYREAWEAIVEGVEARDDLPPLFPMIAHNTLAVLGPAADQLGEWRKTLKRIRRQAVKRDEQELVALVNEVLGLLDAEGDPAGLGTNLTGICAQTWQAIVEQLA